MAPLPIEVVPVPSAAHHLNCLNPSPDVHQVIEVEVLGVPITAVAEPEHSLGQGLGGLRDVDLLNAGLLSNTSPKY